MTSAAITLTPEQQHLDNLLTKCRAESDPIRLWNHLQALKTFLLAHQIQQSTLLHQIQQGQVVTLKLEDKILEECANCLGETKKVVKELHRLLRLHQKDPAKDSMEFRVDAARLLKSFDKSLNHFNEWLVQLSQGSLPVPLAKPAKAGKSAARR